VAHFNFLTGQGIDLRMEIRDKREDVETTARIDFTLEEAEALHRALGDSIRQVRAHRP
jgi:hypothetical protein